MNYVIWNYAIDETLCSLNPVENVKDAYELRYGISRINNFPSNALFRMNPEFKRAIKLSDALDNADAIIVASKRLKEFFESENIPGIEYLRVTILNHKNRVASDEYFIVHQVGTQDCINLDQSTIKWNKINPDQISSIKKLVIDESLIDPKVKLFRAKHLPSTILIERDLINKILSAGFTGIRFKEIDRFRKV
ncbi:MAG: DUF1629 domain-containing protein [bacterium]